MILALSVGPPLPPTDLADVKWLYPLGEGSSAFSGVKDIKWQCESLGSIACLRKSCSITTTLLMEHFRLAAVCLSSLYWCVCQTCSTCNLIDAHLCNNDCVLPEGKRSAVLWCDVSSCLNRVAQYPVWTSLFSVCMRIAVGPLHRDAVQHGKACCNLKTFRWCVTEN